MHPRAGHPVHAARGMVDGMEFPEPRHAVKRAMDPVLHEVREQHDDHELNDERKPDHRGPHAGQGRDFKNRLCRQERQKRQHLHHQAADEVIKEVLAPFLAEDMLPVPAWENPFQRDEQKPGEEDVQDKEVHAEEQRHAAGHLRRGLRAANQRGAQRDHHAAGPERPLPPQHETQRREGKRRQQGEMNGDAKPGIVAQRLRLRNREDARRDQGNDQQQSGDAEHEPEHAADPAAAETAQGRRRLQLAAELHSCIVDFAH